MTGRDLGDVGDLLHRQMLRFALPAQECAKRGRIGEVVISGR
jgi:hypothetical protein